MWVPNGIRNLIEATIVQSVKRSRTNKQKSDTAIAMEVADEIIKLIPEPSGPEQLETRKVEALESIASSLRTIEGLYNGAHR